MRAGGVPATLDFDLAQDRYFGAKKSDIAISQTAGGYVQTSGRLWLPKPPGVLRLSDLGLLVEESRTNSIRNNSMQGAVAGSPGTLPTNWGVPSLAGLTETVVAVGAVNGIDYIDLRYQGTTTGTILFRYFESTLQIAASVGQTFTYSSFLAMVGGSAGNIASIRNSLTERNSVGGVLGILTGQNVLPSLSSNLTRFADTGTTLQATTAAVQPGFAMNFASGVAIDVTIRIGWPQLELGAFATSPIRTTAAAATRAADFITFPVGGWYNSIEGALFAEGSPYAGVLGTPAVLQIGTSTNRIITSLPGVGSNSSPPAAVITSSVTQTAFTNVIGVSPAKSALAYATNNFGAAYNGALQTDNVGSLPSVGATTYLGTNSSGAFYSGYIKRIAYFPIRLPNAELQSLTQ